MMSTVTDHTRTGIADEEPSTFPFASSASATTYSGRPATVSVVSKPVRACSTVPPDNAPGWVPHRARHRATRDAPFQLAETITLPPSTRRPSAGWSDGVPAHSAL